MSPDRIFSPRRAAYVMIFLCVVMVALAGWNVQLKGDIDDGERRAFAGCVRANVMREMLRFAMTELGSPGRAANPAVQEQNCAALYPGGKP